MLRSDLRPILRSDLMPMYKLFEYSKNYSKATGSLWNYYRDEPNIGANNNINYSIKD